MGRCLWHKKIKRDFWDTFSDYDGPNNAQVEAESSTSLLVHPVVYHVTWVAIVTEKVASYDLVQSKEIAELS